MSRIWIICLLTLLFINCFLSQNLKLFIEPNVSISFDSTKLKPGERYSNTYWGTESYSFECFYLRGRQTSLFISSELSDFIPPQKLQDSLLEAFISRKDKPKSDTFSINKKEIILHYKGFSGVAGILKDFRQNKYAIAFTCGKYYKDGLCKIEYISNSDEKIDSYKKDFSVLKKIIDGIQTFSSEDFRVEDSLIKTKYSVVIDSIPPPPDTPPYWQNKFFGKVRVVGKIEHKIKEIDLRLDEGITQSFTPASNGEIIISCYDDQKGKIEKEGRLIVLNSLGKKVKIPFKFYYYR